MPNAVDLAKTGCTPVISDSSGRGGRNKRIDIATVQHLLSVYYRGNSMQNIMPPDGLAEAALEDLLGQCQKTEQKVAKPASLASTNGTTIKRLRNKAGENIDLSGKIDTEVFIKLVQKQFGELDQAAQDGIRFLLGQMMADAQL